MPGSICVVKLVGRASSAVLVAILASACAAEEDDPALPAKFSARFEQPVTGPTSCPVTAIHFTDESTGEPTEWEWTFGDGSTSTEQNPTWETGAIAAEIKLKMSRGDDAAAGEGLHQHGRVLRHVCR